MSATKRSGQGSFVFEHIEDFRRLPAAALPFEQGLHGSTGADKRPGQGELYYGMPGLGILRVSADLQRQDLITLPPDLTPLNYHSTRIEQIDGQPRLVLASNDTESVIIATLAGEVDFVLRRPEYEEYADKEKAYRPTSTTADGNTLYVADGYAIQYIMLADGHTHQFTGIFGGKTDDIHVHGKFGTAHGITRVPTSAHLAVADRSNYRVELTDLHGHHTASHPMPKNSRPCGIDYTHYNGRWYAVVGSLDDPQPGRAAPIYVLDADNYQVISTIRPKEDLGIELADHIHNVIWHQHNGQLYLVAQAWNPGWYFVLGLVR
ncbi:MAG: hypothetical protein IT317_08825 [Anaerolineales bacterium]|nr:hypothetical protein [Anaerolineales bacterium]